MLHSDTRIITYKGPGDSILVRDVCRLQKRGGPGPFRDNVCRRKPYLDRASGRDEVLACLYSAEFDVVVQRDKQADHREDNTQHDDNEVADRERERRVIVKEGRVTGIPGDRISMDESDMTI